MKGRKLKTRERMDSLKDSMDERKKLFKKLCGHIESGYSLDCFPELSDSSITFMMKEYPGEFVEEELICSIRRAKMMWEDIGHRQASGNCLGNSRSWFYNMINRYGWHEKSEVKQDVKGQVSVSIVNYGAAKQS